MRLLNTTSLKLEYFVGDDIPKYAILSHRWEAEEILFEDVQTDEWPQKKGAGKVKRACLRAKDDGFEYIWIDTCCIDKSSSAELSEAINSMFNWYHRSQVCYAYLFDVPSKSFNGSEWFTRGWTLQELIAPDKVQFFDSQWRNIGDRLFLLDAIVDTTAIDRRVLGRGQHHRDCGGQEEDGVYDEECRCGRKNGSRAFRQLLSSFSVATRMSWASRRKTTRMEDEAYALLGLFNVNMPLLYGEGTKAFRRLQEEITRTSNDQSILAGDYSRCVFLDTVASEKDLDVMDDAIGHVFPSRPRAFIFVGDLERPSASSKRLSMTLTNHCLNVDLHVCPCWWRSLKRESEMMTGWLGILACVYSDDYLSRPAILLHRLSSPEDAQPAFMRVLTDDKTSIRISPAPPLEGDERVEISEGGLKVSFDPNRIKMMNINLFLQAPTQAQIVRTPTIKINPTIGGHDDMTYEIQIWLPDPERTPGNHIQNVTFLIRDLQDLQEGMRGLLAIGNRSSHVFFVAYGFSAEDTDFEAPPEFDPWCRLLAWHQVIPRGKFIQKNCGAADIFENMVLFNSLRNHPPESTDKARLRDSMGWPERPGLRAQVEMTPNTFLEQTVYELDISVWRIDGSSEARCS